MKRADDRQSFEVKALLNSVGNALESKLPERVMASFRELVSVGEGQVALENLCTNVADHDVPLDPTTAKELASLCRRLNVPARFWEQLVQED